MIIKWNDESTYYGGICCKMPFKKGDIIPPGIIPESQMKKLLQYGKIRIVKPATFKPVKLSISVMAHPSRMHFFSDLQKKLNIPMSLFAVDENNNIVGNCKAAWRLHDKDADFHVVIQDDAIICNSFKDRAERFIAEMEVLRQEEDDSVYVYNLFTGMTYSPDISQDDLQKGYFITYRNRGGVALCLPVNQIEPMLEFYDTLKIRHDDERISQWIIKNKFKVCFPLPSLIDHSDENTSLMGNGIGNNRRAFRFIDNMDLTIPKIIHQLWIGEKPAPEKWMNSWKEKNPGWDYKLWGEKEIKSQKWINQKHIDYYWKKGMWHGVSDVCTYEILYNHGGFMPGADSICQLPIDDLFFEYYDAYGCYEQEQIRPGFISPLLACVKGSKFAKELIDGLHKLKEVGEPWKSTGNLFMGEMYKKTKQKVKIFPSYVMNPEHFTGMKYEGSGKVYSKQMWGTTINGYSAGVKESEKKPIKLSISVMAHPSRSEFFPYLKERLGDVPFSIDKKNNLLENSKAAWRMYDKEADFHVVVQDDCIVCDNFKERAEKFISEMEEKRILEHRRPQGYNFFLKNADDGSRISVSGNFFVDNVTRAGLSICLPVKLIKPMLEEFDKQKSRHDDDRISGFMKKHDYKIVFPFPSLIDHRIELKSLAGNIVGLKAVKFIDNEKED
jgi:mannosyltransferase OCH1-like enzyme